MSEIVSKCHTHDLKAPKHLRSTTSKIRGFLTGVKNERPDLGRSISMIGKVIDDSSDRESSFNLEEDLIKKYGACKQIIGTGGQSTVWVTQRESSSQSLKTSYAVKGFRHNSGGDVMEFRTRLRDEHLLLSSFKHTNVVQSFDLVENENGSLFAILEYCEIGDLHSFICERKQLIAWEADCFMIQMMRAVDFLHENGIAHRDLKPENMMLTKSGIIKIADFGESERFRIGDVDLAMVGGVCGSSPYIAPEVFTSTHYSARAADVWSMGVIYMAMRLGRYMWVTAEMSDPLYVRYVEQRKTEEGYVPIEKIGKVSHASMLSAPCNGEADFDCRKSVATSSTLFLIQNVIVA